MAATYRFPLGGDPQAKLNLLKMKAAQKGVKFVGTVDHGSFSGMGLQGSYVGEGSEIVVTINRVPIIYTVDQVAAMIEEFLRE